MYLLLPLSPSPSAGVPLATDFTLQPPDIPNSHVPVRIANSGLGCIWYKKDDKFKIPKGERVCVCVRLYVLEMYYHQCNLFLLVL